MHALMNASALMMWESIGIDILACGGDATNSFPLAVRA